MKQPNWPYQKKLQIFQKTWFFAFDFMTVKLTDPRDNENNQEKNPRPMFKFYIDQINKMLHQQQYKNHYQTNSPGQFEIKQSDQDDRNNTCDTDATEINKAKMGRRNQ